MVSIKEDLAKFYVKLVVETIAIFDEGFFKEINTNLSSNMPLAIRVTFLLDIVDRIAWKYRNLHLRIVWLINDNNMLVFSILVSILLVLHFYML